MVSSFTFLTLYNYDYVSRLERAGCFLRGSVQILVNRMGSGVSV